MPMDDSSKEDPRTVRMIARLEKEVQLLHAAIDRSNRALVEAVKVKIERDRYKVALEAVRRGDCWCGMAIGNPMVRDHSEGCKMALDLIEPKRGN